MFRKWFDFDDDDMCRGPRGQISDFCRAWTSIRYGSDLSATTTAQSILEHQDETSGGEVRSDRYDTDGADRRVRMTPRRFWERRTGEELLHVQAEFPQSGFERTPGLETRLPTWLQNVAVAVCHVYGVCRCGGAVLCSCPCQISRARKIW